MSLMEQFADPTYFEGLSMGERLTGATVTMCMGLGITFAVPASNTAAHELVVPKSIPIILLIFIISFLIFINFYIIYFNRCTS